MKSFLTGTTMTVVIAMAMTFVAQAETTSDNQEKSAVKTVSKVDLERYVGTWYEIARYPNWFQKKCQGAVSALYRQRADGNIDVINRCRTNDGKFEQAEGVARVVSDSGNAKLKVRFAPAWLSWLPMVWGDYWVIGLAPDYSWAVVGEPNRKTLWILARTPRLTDAAYRSAMQQAEAQGFELKKLTKTQQ